jgi:hypothetical protein
MKSAAASESARQRRSEGLRGTMTMSPHRRNRPHANVRHTTRVDSSCIRGGDGGGGDLSCADDHRRLATRDEMNQLHRIASHHRRSIARESTHHTHMHSCRPNQRVRMWCRCGAHSAHVDALLVDRGGVQLSRGVR